MNYSNISQFIEAQFGYANLLVYDYCDPFTLAASYRLVAVTKGEFLIKYMGSHLRAPVGSVMMIPPKYKADFDWSENAECKVLYFRTLLFGTIDLTHVLAPVSVFAPTLEVWRELVALFDILIKHAERKKTSDVMITDGTTNTILGLCWEPLGLGNLYRISNKELPAWLAHILQHIRHYPMISVNELVSMSGYSRSRFRNLFQHYVGIGPSDYLLRNRLELAQHMLNNTEMSIYQIAEELGFASSSNFTRFFINLTGITPEKFRNLDPQLKAMDTPSATAQSQGWV